MAFTVAGGKGAATETDRSGAWPFSTGARGAPRGGGSPKRALVVIHLGLPVSTPTLSIMMVHGTFPEARGGE